MSSDYIVDFTLPTDRGLFIHHGTTVYARNAKEASKIFLSHFPEASVRKVELGLVVGGRGKKYATWDSSLGADCHPARPEDCV